MDSKTRKDAIVDALNKVPETIYAHRKRATFIISEIDQVQKKANRRLKVLDIGCGTGQRLTIPVASCLEVDVLGIDLHGPSIERALSSRGPNLTFEKADISELIEQGREFDVVICSEVLEHLFEPEQLLRSILQVIRPQGLLIVTIPNGWGPKELEWKIYDLLRPVARIVKRLFRINKKRSTRVEAVAPTAVDSLNSDCGHVQFFTMRAFRRLASASQFRITNQENRRLFSGPFSSRIIAHRKPLIKWNVRLASHVPYWLVSSWMFALSPCQAKDSFESHKT